MFTIIFGLICMLLSVGLVVVFLVINLVLNHKSDIEDEKYHVSNYRPIPPPKKQQHKQDN